MEQGSLNELVLTRSVTKHIRKHNKKLVSGTGIGDDYASFTVDSDNMVCTEGWGTMPQVAWYKAMNNLSVSGGKPVGVRLQLMLPCDIEESAIKSFMSEFNSIADENGIQIMGGHTQISKAYSYPTFFVTAMGVMQEYVPTPKKVEPGYDIIMTKYAGILGTDILVNSKADILEKRLSKGYIRGGFFGQTMYDVSKDAHIAAKFKDNVCYIHDVSYGGVYGALWQLGVKINQGIRINHYNIPIKQETIEFCEIFDINPYMLEGTGSLLIVARQGDEIVKAFIDEGIPAAVIGKVTESRDRLVVLGDSNEKRFLAPVKGDEIYKVVSAY